MTTIGSIIGALRSGQLVEKIGRRIRRILPPSSAQFEREVQLLAGSLPPGGTVVDVGSNVGSFAACFLRKGHRVISIEPTTHCCAAQEKTFARAIRDGRLALERCACSDAAGHAELFVSDDPGGAFSSLERDWPRETFKEFFVQHKTEAVRLVRLADMLARYQSWLSPFSLLKIDTEGHEPKVLAGLFTDDWPSRGIPAPHYVMFEFNAMPMHVSRLTESLEILRANGYVRFKFFVRHDADLLHETEWLSSEAAGAFDVLPFNAGHPKAPPAFRYGNVIAHK